MNTVIDGVARCVELNAHAFTRLRAFLKPGLPETAVAAELERLYAEKAGGPIRFEGDIVSGERTAAIGGEATPRVLRAGDAVILDMQPFAEGFCCDTTRTFFLGEPGGEIRRVYRYIEGALAVGEEALRPGARANGVYAAVAAYLNRNPFGMTFPHHAGHALSRLPFEPPQLLDTCSLPLEEGRIFALEPGLYSDRYGIRLENNYILTKTGCFKIGDLPTAIENYIC